MASTTPRIQVRVPTSVHPSGRLVVTSGAKTKRELERVRALLYKIRDQRRHDLLRALADHQIALSELIAADMEDRLSFLAVDLVLYRPLWDTMDAFVDDNGDQGARYKIYLQQLRARQVLPEGASVRDLDRINWKDLQQRWGKGPADWNHLRSAVSRFLTVQLGDVYHPFRRQVMRHFPKLKAPAGRVPDLTPEKFWEVVAAAPEWLRAAYVVLVLTGMRLGEYLRCTEANILSERKGIRVPGTKTEGSADVIFIDARMWGWIEAGIPSPLGENRLRIRWREACAAVGVENVTMHDLRHCHGQWITDKGVPEKYVQQSLRHASPDMTRRYTRSKDIGVAAEAIATVLDGKDIDAEDND